MMYLYSEPPYNKLGDIGTFENVRFSMNSCHAKCEDTLVFSMTAVKMVFVGENVEEWKLWCIPFQRFKSYTMLPSNESFPCDVIVNSFSDCIVWLAKSTVNGFVEMNMSTVIFTLTNINYSPYTFWLTIGNWVHNMNVIYLPPCVTIPVTNAFNKMYCSIHEFDTLYKIWNWAWDYTDIQ